MKNGPIPIPLSIQMKKVEVASPTRCFGDSLTAIAWAQDIIVPKPRATKTAVSRRMKLLLAWLSIIKLNEKTTMAG